MAIASTDVINAFPELSVVASSTWTWAIAEAYAELANDGVTFPVTGDVDRAATLLAAHYARLATTAFPKGMTSEEHVGGVGRTLVLPQGLQPDDYSLTVYGIMFRRFVRKAADYWCVA